MSKWAKVSIPVAAVFAIAFLVLLGLGIRSGRQTTPMSPSKVAEYNKPGTVYIETLSDADITIPNLTIDEQKLINKLLPMVQTGAIANEDDAVQAAINEFLTNPDQYIIPGAGSQSKHVQTGVSGTGFIINPDGYLITNAHVVKQTDAELKQSLAQVGLGDIITSDIQSLESSLGISLTDDQKQKLEAAEANVYAQNLTMQNVQTQSQMYLGVTVPGVGTVQKGQPLEIVKAGEETPGKDVAIMKVNAGNLPTVPLGDSGAVQDGQQAIALGYPGAATFNPLIDQGQENVKPSLTVGSVSGRKTMPGGWDVLQMDTAITHGNSGGPLFNGSGQVIGITTFGSPNQSGQGEVQGFNFAVPTSIVNEFLNEANIKASEGELTKTYRQAVDLFDAGHYSAAKDKLKEVSDTNGAFPYVSDMISQATAKIDAGQDSPVFPYPVYLMVILGVIAIGAAGASGFFLLKPLFGKPGGPPAAGGPGAFPGGGAAPGGAPPAPGETAYPAQTSATPAVETTESMQPAPPPAETPGPEEPPAAAAGAGTEPGLAAGLAPEPAKEAPAEEPVEAQAVEEPTVETPAAEEAPPAAPEAQQPEEEPGQEPEEAPRFCANCGHAIPPDAKFCPNCAKPINR